MRTLVLSQRGRFRNDLDVTHLAVALNDPHNLLWLDIQDPNDEDIALLREQFGFHPLAVEDAVRAHERPKVDTYGVPGDLDGDGVADLTIEEPTGEPVLIPLEPVAAPSGDEEAAPLNRAYYFVVFYAAAYHAEDDHIEAQPVSLFIGANYLVT
ncbi:MAG: hypothetical protein N2439_12935, partial [Anaerolineae bacterium]|nr:hypothetical protein [Anaerolineae bacterium]